MNKAQNIFRALVALTIGPVLSAQTLYVPSGTGGIGASGNSNVGVGGVPAAKFEVFKNATGGRWQFVDEGADSYNAINIRNNANSAYLPLLVRAAYHVWNVNGADRMILDANGTLSVTADGSATTTTLALRTTNQNNYLNLIAGSSMDAAGEISFQRNGANDGNFYYGGSASGQHIWRSGGYTTRMVLDGAGNLGIGVTSPGAKLEIGGGGGSAGVQTFFSVQAGYSAPSAGNVAFSGGTKLVLWNDVTTPQKLSIGMDENADMWFNSAGNQSGAGFTFYTGNGVSATPAARLKITKDGNVGIGTTNPSQKLSVNGTVRAKEVIVETTGWSDDVFDPNYRLAPLSEVEAHIKSEKHLPDIPSASEVAEQGVAVGDMQAKLLRKIEELTLHVIEQEKQRAAQDERLAAQDRRIRELEARLDGQPDR